MKTIAMILAILMVLTVVIPSAEARTDRTQGDVLYQRWSSLVYPSPTRLKNFCSDNDLIVESYERRVCKSDGESCRKFLAARWQQYCRYTSTGGIRDYNYLVVFSEIRDQMDEKNLRFLRNRHDETVAVAEPITEDTLVISGQTTGTGGNPVRIKRVIQ